MKWAGSVFELSMALRENPECNVTSVLTYEPNMGGRIDMAYGSSYGIVLRLQGDGSIELRDINKKDAAALRAYIKRCNRTYTIERG